MPPRKYDNTVARIAGNILSGFPFHEYDSDEISSHLAHAVAMARMVVAETIRTEPEPASEE